MKILSTLIFLCALAVATAASSISKGWIHDEELMKLQEDKHPHSAPEFIVDLDAAPEERWKEIGELYADKAWQIVNYLRVNLPTGWLKPLEKLCSNLLPFFQDYGDEMAGYAKALGITEGDIVMVNLVYQLERLGLSCDSWNTTGPTMTCERSEVEGSDGQEFADLILPWKNIRGPDSLSGPGACTSFVASNTAGKVFHGRNLDWNLGDNLKQFIINVQFMRGGAPLYKATTVVGFVGILHAIKPGKFGYSMDARRKGGNIPFNLLEALLVKGTRTPEQHARYTFENTDNYDDMVNAMGDHDIVNPLYYILSGAEYPQGAVLARDRAGVVHDYRMDEIVRTPGGNVQQDFWVGITNYDLELPPLPADDRATPMTDNVNALAGKEFDADDIWNIIETWPTMNPHTDISAVMDIKEGTFDVLVWFDHGVKK